MVQDPAGGGDGDPTGHLSGPAGQPTAPDHAQYYGTPAGGRGATAPRPDRQDAHHPAHDGEADQGDRGD